MVCLEPQMTLQVRFTRELQDRPPELALGNHPGCIGMYICLTSKEVLHYAVLRQRTSRIQMVVHLTLVWSTLLLSSLMADSPCICRV